MPKWLDNESNIKRKSQKQEKKLAAELGGKIVAGSGNSSWGKGDIKLEEYLVESKSTEKDRFTITKGILEKIEEEAIRSQRKPLLVLTIQGRCYLILRSCDLDVSDQSSVYICEEENDHE